MTKQHIPASGEQAIPIRRYRHVAEDEGDRYSLYTSVLHADKNGCVVKYADHVKVVAALEAQLAHNREWEPLRKAAQDVVDWAAHAEYINPSIKDRIDTLRATLTSPTEQPERVRGAV